MLSPRTLISDLLERSLLLAPLLIELHVDCIGCSLNKFCTLEDLCTQYKMDLELVLRKIQERLEQKAT